SGRGWVAPARIECRHPPCPPGHRRYPSLPREESISRPLPPRPESPLPLLPWLAAAAEMLLAFGPPAAPWPFGSATTPMPASTPPSQIWPQTSLWISSCSQSLQVVHFSVPLTLC